MPAPPLATLPPEPGAEPVPLVDPEPDEEPLPGAAPLPVVPPLDVLSADPLPEGSVPPGEHAANTPSEASNIFEDLGKKECRGTARRESLVDEWFNYRSVPFAQRNQASIAPGADQVALDVLLDASPEVDHLEVG